MSDELDNLRSEANKLQAILVQKPGDQYCETELEKTEAKIVKLEKLEAKNNPQPDD